MQFPYAQELELLGQNPYFPVWRRSFPAPLPSYRAESLERLLAQSAPESVGRFVGRTFAPLKAAAAFALAFLGEGLAFASAAFSARTVFPRAAPPAAGMGLGGPRCTLRFLTRRTRRKECRGVEALLVTIIEKQRHANAVVPDLPQCFAPAAQNASCVRVPAR